MAIAAAAAVVLATVGVAGGATGDLTYEGCITGETESGPAGSGACSVVKSKAPSGTDSGLDGARYAALSPDGSSLYVVAAGDDGIARFKRDTTTGELTYKGCTTSETESGPAGSGACALIGSASSLGANSGLDLPQSVALSADGKSLYVASFSDDAIAHFRRDTTSGALTYAGCVTGETESGPAGSGACSLSPSAASGGASSGLDGLVSVALSSDDSSLYAASASDDAITRFKRDTTTGALTHKGCITGESESGPAGSGACTAIGSAAPSGANSGLDRLTATSLTLSADGASLYVASLDDHAIARFKRNASGALAYEGCVTGESESGPAGSGACTAIGSAASSGANSGLDSPTSVALSADGGSLYVTSQGDDAVARFTRDPTDGALKYKGCITGEIESGPAGSGACDAIGSAALLGSHSGLGFPVSTVVSADGSSLYVASLDDDAVARFRRKTTGGKLTYRGCITGETQSGPAGSGACAAIGSAGSSGSNSGLDGARSVVLSADATSLYAVARDDDAVARFSRTP